MLLFRPIFKMDVLKRAMRNSQAKSKREKIPEGWGENKEPVAEGVTFFLKYIGSTLVAEVEGGETYGDGTSAKAVHNIIMMAKTIGKKLRKTSLTVSPQGIRMVDMTTDELMFDLSIYRISFCTADKDHSNVFAYIARNTTNETMECHAFLCAKSKIAHAVTLTVSQAFSIAQDRWAENKNYRKSLKEKAKKENNFTNGKTNGSTYHTEYSSSTPPKIPLSPHIKSSSKASDYSPIKSSPAKSSSAKSSPAKSSPAKSSPAKSSPTKSTSSEERDSRQNWLSFDESEGDDVDDLFSRLAENRMKRLPSFGTDTDLKSYELDAGVQQYMDERICFEAFSRTKSVEDLLNL